MNIAILIPFRKFLLGLLFLGMLSNTAVSQDGELNLSEDQSADETFKELELLDSSDINTLYQDDDIVDETVDLSDLEEIDDLQSLKDDIGTEILKEEKKKSKGSVSNSVEDILKSSEEITDDIESKVILQEKDDSLKNTKIFNDEELSVDNKTSRLENRIFDIGVEEKQLIELSELVEGKIPDSEWDEIASTAKVSRYEVQEGDWLWKISKNLFGSGFYYSKIWSLNPHITNPHVIEPGMILVFSTGDELNPPQVSIGDFGANELEDPNRIKTAKKYFDYTQFGDNVEPDWIAERKKLINQGIYFQYASEETYEDLQAIGKKSLRDDYEKYSPPANEIIISEPDDSYDASGFDKSSKVIFDVKEGFFLNTFVTTNIVEDLGFIEAYKGENLFARRYSNVFVKFDDSLRVKPGDLFSIYSADGKVSHPISDRSGFRYTVNGQIKALRKRRDLWECAVEDITGIVNRKDRITVYTPRINKIVQNFNSRRVEAAVIDSFKDTVNSYSFGDVVYLDRGRADGLDVGNVLEFYDFIDRGTGKKITPDPTYKNGEVTVISLTDNFATGIISSSNNEIPLGSIAITKSKEKAALESKVRKGIVDSGLRGTKEDLLDELDVELNLDTFSEDLLKEADKVKLTEDELEELERQEREKSIIKDYEKDLRELEKLENEISDAEAALNEEKLDEDKFLEQQDLDEIEQGIKSPDKNSFEAINELESDLGVKFLDEDLNSKENPYGLTEFDLEEIDDLLNTESQ